MQAVDSRAMQEIDRRATEEYGIPEIVLMENAGLRAADLILREFGTLQGKIGLFCGRGKNGGDGFVVARHLFLWEKNVSVFLVGDSLPSGPSSQTNLTILQKIGCPWSHHRSLPELLAALRKEGPFQLIVDALLGIGLKGEIREPLLSTVLQLNRLQVPIVSLDIPSGLCADTGKILGSCIRADWTVTFGLPKRGLFQGEGPRMAGRVVVEPIGLPLRGLTP